MWSLTIAPRTVSAGHVAHQPTTSTVRPASDRMFHSAFTLRIWLVTGSCSPVFSFTATKWPMRCWSGVLPVAIVVQMIGLSIGLLLSSRPYAPSCRSRAKFGILPSDISRSTVSGSMPSRPRTMIFPGAELPWHPPTRRRTRATANHRCKRIGYFR